MFIADFYTPPALYNFDETYNGMPGIFGGIYFCNWDNSDESLNDIPFNIVIERIRSRQFARDLLKEIDYR